jgi:hypothetical protein
VHSPRIAAQHEIEALFLAMIRKGQQQGAFAHVMTESRTTSIGPR